MNILIIGYGRVGREIARNLNKISSIDKIFVYSKENITKLKLKKVVITHEFENLKNIEYIIISVAGVPKKIWNEMMNSGISLYEEIIKEFDFNFPEVKSLVNKLKQLPKETKIILLTNPLDILTNYLNKELNNKVLGFGGELDVIRYKKELGKKVFCIGVHNNCVPIFNLKSEEQAKEINQALSNKVMALLRKEGMTHKLTGKKFKIFFEKLISPKEKIITISYANKNELAYTRPFYVKEGNILEPKKVKENAIEKELIEKTCLELKKNIEVLTK